MIGFWRFYEWVEITFWNTLGKKLCSFLFISLFQLILGSYLFLTLDGFREQLRAGPLTDAMRLTLASRVDHAIGWSFAFWLLTLFFIRCAVKQRHSWR